MLSTISWPQYFAAIAVTGTCYYSYIFLRYYQCDISGLLTRKPAGSSIPESSFNGPISVIGAIKEDPSVSHLDEKEAQFTGDDPAAIADDDAQSEVATNAAPESLQQQLVKETDQLMEAFATEGNKGEFISLFRILLDAYRQHASELDLPALTDYILQSASARLPFPLSADDLPHISD